MTNDDDDVDLWLVLKLKTSKDEAASVSLSINSMNIVDAPTKIRLLILMGRTEEFMSMVPP